MTLDHAEGAVLTVLAINRRLRLVILNDDRTLPITNWFDAEGEEVDGPEDAVSFVAGEGDTWITEALAGFTDRTN